MTEDLSTAFFTAYERVYDTSNRPMLYLVDVNTANPDGCVHVEIHIKW